MFSFSLQPNQLFVINGVIGLRIRSLTSDANADDCKTDLESEAGKSDGPMFATYCLPWLQVNQARVIKAQAKAVLQELRKQATA